MAPAQTDYLYYVLAGKDGHHAFASTLRGAAAEHRGGQAAGAAVITGATRVAGVIGDPVRHSLSPRLHNAAYRALGLDWVFVAFEVPDGGARGRARRGARRSASSACRSRCRTRPRSPALCDELSPDAAGAAQRQHRDARRPTAASPATRPTATGFLRSLADAGVDPAGSPVLVLGARRRGARGGAGARRRAARAVAVAARRRAAAAEPRPRSRRGAAIAWDDRADAAAAADIVVNATPVGMAGDALAAGPGRRCSAAGHVVVDLVYEPLETPLLAAARAGGARGRPGSACSCTRPRSRSSAGAAGPRRSTRCGPPSSSTALTGALKRPTPRSVDASPRTDVASEPRRHGGYAVLQGTFETLSLPEVLGLLASARKSGALWLDAGPIVGRRPPRGRPLPRGRGRRAARAGRRRRRRCSTRLVDVCFAVDVPGDRARSGSRPTSPRRGVRRAGRAERRAGRGRPAAEAVARDPAGHPVARLPPAAARRAGGRRARGRPRAVGAARRGRRPAHGRASSCSAPAGR